MHSAPDNQKALSGLRVAVVVFSHYPSDPRPRREAELLAHEGAEVDVISLVQDAEDLRAESFNGVKVTRVPLRKRRGGKLSYFGQYFWFILSAAGRLAWRSLRRRYHLIHVHNMPDVLVFSALVPRLLGARVILDQHDPMPELMMSIYGKTEDSRIVRVLKRLERWSLNFADAVVTVNLACKRIFTRRGCEPGKLHVVMNSPDENIFQFKSAAAPALHRESVKPFVIMYHGSIVERHGLDLAVEAVAQVRKQHPNLTLRIYGRSTPFLEQVMADVKIRRLEQAVEYLGGKNLDQIVAAIDACDLGIIPNKRSIFTEINTPTRIFEYLSRGKPVLAPQAGGIEDYFTPDSLLLFELGSAADLARQIRFAIEHPNELEEIVRRGQAVYQQHRWSSERELLLNLVKQLTSPQQPCRCKAARDETATTVA